MLTTDDVIMHKSSELPHSLLQGPTHLVSENDTHHGGSCTYSDKGLYSEFVHVGCVDKVVDGPHGW